MLDEISTVLDSMKCEKSKQDRRDMEAALGFAISSWARLEGALSLMFQRAIDRVRSDISSAVFDTIHSQEVKIDVVDAAMQRRFNNDPDTLSEWNQLYKDADRLRRIRNHLAHSQIIQRFPNMRYGTTRLIPHHHLYTHLSYEAFKRKWTTKQVRAFGDEFADVSVRMHDLAMRLRDKILPSPAPRERLRKDDPKQD